MRSKTLATALSLNLSLSLYCPCIFANMTCPLSKYLKAQELKQVASYELNFCEGDCTHFSKQTSANFATTSLNTALRFSSSKNCCIFGSICCRCSSCILSQCSFFLPYLCLLVKIILTSFPNTNWKTGLILETLSSSPFFIENALATKIKLSLERD